jgi:hypothetical protein
LEVRAPFFSRFRLASSSRLAGVAHQRLDPRAPFGPSVAGSRVVARLQRQLHNRFAAEEQAGDSPGARNLAMHRRRDSGVEDAPAGVYANVLVGRQEGQSGRGFAGQERAAIPTRIITGTAPRKR